MSVLRRALLAALLAAPIWAQAADPRPFDAASPRAIDAAHAGKPYVLVLWSLYCEPCRDEMAHWKALRRRYPGVPVVLVSTDSPGERATVVEFLKRYDPGAVESWIFADEYSERVRYAVDPAWRGELPRTYLFDAAHRSEGRSGRFDQRWIEGWLAAQGTQRRK